MKKIILFLLVGFNFLIIGCSNLTSPSKSDMTINDFPTKQGTYWVYKITDFVKNTSDILTVSILGNATLSNNQLASIWEYKYSDHTDTMFVAINVDTILFYNAQYYAPHKFIFPLTVGNSWDTNTGKAEVTTFEYVPTITLSGYFSYKVTIYPTHWGNTGGNEQYFISPDVGIIRFDNLMFETDVSQRYHTLWELRYFHRG